MIGAEHMRGIGRPMVRIEINFNDPCAQIKEIEKICTNTKIMDNIQLFGKALLKISVKTIEQYTQVEYDEDHRYNNHLNMLVYQGIF